MRVPARVLVPGWAEGAVAAIAPLSFWGGYDATEGRVTDRSHSAFGANLRGVILVMTSGRGSSSSSSVLAEAIRRGTAPAGIVLTQADAVLSVGALVAAELYGLSCPVVVVGEDAHPALKQAARLTIEAQAEPAFVVD